MLRLRMMLLDYLVDRFGEWPGLAISALISITYLAALSWYLG